MEGLLTPDGRHGARLGREEDRRWPDVELARAAVSVLSRVDAATAKEFHTQAFKSFCAKYDGKYSYKTALRALEILGEVQRLAKGYWFPTPVRGVLLSSRILILAPIPTERLSREFVGVTIAGLGRVAPAQEAASLPLQALDSWLRTNGAESKVHRDGSGNLLGGPFLSSNRRPSIEYLSIANDQLRRARWIRDFGGGLVFGGGMRLCRERTSPTTYVYFLFKELSRRGYAEAPLLGSIRPFQIAAAAAAGTPFRYSMEPIGNGKVRFFLGIPLPSSEFRLVCAIGRREESDRQGFVVDDTEAPLLEERLVLLGLERKL
jgi:hypothetical protein